VVFIILGAGVGLAGFALTSAPIASKIAGSLLIVFGLFVLGTLKFPWLNYEKRLTPSLGTTTSYLRSLLIGAIFSLAWTPCVAGLLGGTLALALGSDSVWQGAYLLGTFSLGLGLPFIIMGLAFDSIAPLLKRIRRYSTSIYIVSGLLLIAVGVAVITNNLTWF
jgi:cytochrome c-type biogenesis protein